MEAHLRLEHGDIGNYSLSMHDGVGGAKKEGGYLDTPARSRRVRCGAVKAEGTEYDFLGQRCEKRPSESITSLFRNLHGEHFFECKDGTSDPAKPVKFDVNFEEVYNDPCGTTSRTTTLSGTLTLSNATLLSGTIIKH